MDFRKENWSRKINVYTLGIWRPFNSLRPPKVPKEGSKLNEEGSSQQEILR
jgi:hypothetical protein